MATFDVRVKCLYHNQDLVIDVPNPELLTQVQTDGSKAMFEWDTSNLTCLAANETSDEKVHELCNNSWTIYIRSHRDGKMINMDDI